jgi:hypothetical protein
MVVVAVVWVSLHGLWLMLCKRINCAPDECSSGHTAKGTVMVVTHY